MNDDAKNRYGYRGTLGILMIISSLLVLIVEMLTHSTFRILDQMIFGDRKMQIVNNIIGDNFHGLNTDMHFERSLVIILILGVLLYSSSRKETE